MDDRFTPHDIMIIQLCQHRLVGKFRLKIEEGGKGGMTIFSKLKSLLRSSSQIKKSARRVLNPRRFLAQVDIKSSLFFFSPISRPKDNGFLRTLCGIPT